MKRFFYLILFFFLAENILQAQLGWNYMTLGPNAGADMHFNKLMYSGGIQFDHFRQKKGFDIYGKYYYKSASLNFGYSPDNILSYSVSFSSILLRKRLFEVFTELRYKDRPIPPEKSHFLYIPGLRIYPLYTISPVAYQEKSDWKLFVRPGLGLMINYGHLATWDADYRLSVRYFYNIPVNGHLPMEYSQSMICVHLGIGFKLNKQEEEK
jgi:hypothetical protein